MKCNQSRPGFELVSPCPFPTTIIITPRAPPTIILYEIFTSALADGFSLETKWQQVSSDFLDSSQNSGWSKKCCSLDGLNLYSNFQPFQPLSKLLVSLLPSCSIAFLVLWQGLSICLSFRFLLYLLYGLLGRQSLLHNNSSFFLLIITRFGFLAKIKWSVCISKCERIIYISFSRTNSGLCIYHFVV